MRVQFLKSISGDRFAYDVDEIADVPDDDARKWIASGVASPLHAERQAAAIRPPERAVRPKPKFRRPGARGR